MAVKLIFFLFKLTKTLKVTQLLSNASSSNKQCSNLLVKRFMLITFVTINFSDILLGIKGNF